MTMKRYSDFSDGGRLPSSDRDHLGSLRTDDATESYGEAPPDSQPRRRVRLQVCAAERDRKQAIRAGAEDKSGFPPSTDAKGVRPDHRSGTP